MSKPFLNPYGEYTTTSHTRVNAWWPRDSVHRFIRGIDFESGVIQTTLNLLVEKLIHALTERGITDLSKQSEFRHFVANSVLTLPDERSGVAVDGIVVKKPIADVAGGVDELRPGHSNEKNKRSDVQSSTSRGKQKTRRASGRKKG